MTDEHDQEDSKDALSESVLARLDEPATWEPTPAGGLGPLLDQMRDESAGASTDDATPVPATTEPSNVVGLRDKPPRTMPFIAGVAAGLLLPLVIGLAIFGLSRSNGEEAAAPEPDFSIDLDATDLAPEADALVEFTNGAAGTRIKLDLTGLPPAEPGTYYEAWIADSNDAVSTGTFHLRGGDDSIVLWAGVPASDFDVFAITIQDIGEVVGSDLVVLAGELP